MTASTVKAILPCGVQRVWETVSAAAQYPDWRSDVSKTEVIDEKRFTVYTKDGYATTFTITAAEPLKRWELALENDHVSGRWSFVFTSKDDETALEATVSGEAKALTTRPVGKSRLEQVYFQKALEQFVTDLKASLG